MSERFSLRHKSVWYQSNSTKAKDALECIENKTAELSAGVALGPDSTSLVHLWDSVPRSLKRQKLHLLHGVEMRLK